MKELIRQMIESALQSDELEMAMQSIIEDQIDYDELAAQILGEYDIEDMIHDIAVMKLEETPF